MEKIYCDKCGCELTPLTNFRTVIGGTPVETFDLCGDCREDLIDWLAGCQTVETTVEVPIPSCARPVPAAEAGGKPSETAEDARVAEARAAFEKAMAEAEAEDPLYGGPKNDKTGYTVEALMTITKKNFYGVLAGLERIGVIACSWERGGRWTYRFYLSPDQVEKLKK